MTLIRKFKKLNSVLTFIFFFIVLQNISIKSSSAFSFQVVPSLPEEIQTKPGDIIEFYISANFRNSDVDKYEIIGYHLDFKFDNEELSEISRTFKNLEFFADGSGKQSSFEIGTIKFRVNNPLKDGNTDAYFGSIASLGIRNLYNKEKLILYAEDSAYFNEGSDPLVIKNGADVVPVPEPSSILGILAFGAGIILKRKWKLFNSTKKETKQAS